MSNSELARWQANHQNEPASVIIAEQEWLDRRLARQLRASFFVAIFGIAGTLAGIVLGWQLRSYSMDEHVIQYHGERSPKNQQQQEKPSTENEKPSAISAPTPVPQPRPNEDDTKTKKQ